jgi:hypothetical protein
MIKYISTLVLVLLGEFVCSQQTYFSNNYDIFQWANYTGANLQCSDSNYIFISTNIGPNIWGFSFVKVAPNGDTLFTKQYIYNDRSPSVATYSNSIFETQDGSFYACGSYIDTSNNREGFLVKFNSSGDTLWTRNYTGVGYDQINSVIEDSTGRLVLGGTTTSMGNGQGDFWLMKVSALDGSVIWSRSYGSSAYENGFITIKDMAGGYVMSGQSTNQPYLVRTDTAGNLIWLNNYNFNGYGFVVQTTDTGYLVACNKILSASETDGCIFKLNQNGVYQWHKYVGLPGNTDILYTQPIILADGLVCSGISQPANGYPLGYLVKTDSLGNLSWQRTYAKSPVFHNYLYDVSATFDNGFLLSGSCIIANSDAWLLKVDSLGCEVAGCDGVGISSPESNVACSVFPNPSGDWVTFSFASPAVREIRIYDNNGRLVKICVDESLEQTLNMQSLSEGLYFYSVIEEGNSVAQGRIVIAR